MRKHDKHGHQIRQPVLTQVHCHQHLETGCCGLAGNFGLQVGHGE